MMPLLEKNCEGAQMLERQKLRRGADVRTAMEARAPTLNCACRAKFQDEEQVVAKLPVHNTSADEKDHKISNPCNHLPYLSLMTPIDCCRMLLFVITEIMVLLVLLVLLHRNVQTTHYFTRSFCMSVSCKNVK